MRYYLLIFAFFCLFSCKKEEKIYYSNGKPKYINVWDGNILKVNRYDENGDLLFVGNYRDNQLVDTVFVYGQEDNYFIKIDSSYKNFFYGTYISEYSTGKSAKISLLRFKKSKDIDSILASSLLYGKEVVYEPNGKLARETHYKIVGDSSIKMSEKIYNDSQNK